MQATATPSVVVPRSSILKQQKTKQANVHPLVSLFAGSVAGGVEATITYPFEYAKTRAQLRSAPGAQGSVFQMLRSTISAEGVSGIYTGCTTLVAGTALKAGVRFLAFDSIKKQLVDNDGKLSTSRGILSGMAAGAVESLLAVTPTERIKTALIDDAKGAKRFRSGPHAIKTLISEQGIAGLYRGLISTTIKQSATSAVRMGSYNALRTQYTTRMGHAPKSTLETFAMGAVAGCITVYATQPFDTVKTAKQSRRDFAGRHSGHMAGWRCANLLEGKYDASGQTGALRRHRVLNLRESAWFLLVSRIPIADRYSYIVDLFEISRKSCHGSQQQHGPPR
jgi:solute carrier family 25 citrate transporter 1